MKKILLLILTTTLFGCMTWYKPGAQQGEFERDKYQCLQESQQRVGAAQVNAWGGSAVNTVQTNEMLFNNCMNARGWSLQNKQALENQLQQQQASASIAQSQAQFEIDRLNAKANAICTNPDLKAYYAKSPCRSGEASFEQLADSSKITAAQKAVLVKQRAAIADYQKDQIAMNKRFGGKAARIASIYEGEIIPAQDQLNLDLYNGKITWGEYNKQRKDINNRFNEKIKNL